jgi:hypothetical protein
VKTKWDEFLNQDFSCNEPTNHMWCLRLFRWGCSNDLLTLVLKLEPQSKPPSLLPFSVLHQALYSANLRMQFDLTFFFRFRLNHVNLEESNINKTISFLFMLQCISTVLTFPFFIELKRFSIEWKYVVI